ncbi:MAG: hypothetical protein KGY51_01920 [Psychroflexus sp.]|nr:hypothetical protein [Psychroflexus sp.]
MKTIILIITLGIYSVNAQIQKHTVLPDSLYNTIKFEGVLFTDIKATNADIQQLNKLLLNTKAEYKYRSKTPNAVSIDMYGYTIGEPQRVFNYNTGLMIAFSSEDNTDNFVIVRLETNNVTINDITLEIGDPISKLKNIDYIIAEGPFNNKFVSIIKPNGYETPISIDLDRHNRIETITYFENP